MKKHLKSYWLWYLVGSCLSLLFSVVFVWQYFLNREAAKEPVGIYANRPIAAGVDLSVCFYSVRTPIRWWETGGSFFRTIAADNEYTVRANADTVEQATAQLAMIRTTAAASGRRISEISIVDHSGVASPRICGHPLTQSFYDEVKLCVKECGTTRLNFLGCNVGKGAEGEAYANHWAKECGLTIWAATKKVGESTTMVEKQDTETWTAAVIRNGKHKAFRGQ